MVLASRLGEDSNKSVLLIEAGNDTRRDARVRTLRLDTQSLWWNVQTRQQVDGSYRKHSSGIGLGGSTTINGAKVDGPQSGQIDAFQQFGNPSWSWSRVAHYMKKSQNYQAPNDLAKGLGATSFSSSCIDDFFYSHCFIQSLNKGALKNTSITVRRK